MPFNALFLPLLGGYLLFTHFNGTRYRASGYPAQRLIFPAAALGILLYAVARCVEMIVLQARVAPELWLDRSVGRALPAAAVPLVLSVTAAFLVSALGVPKKIAESVPYLTVPAGHPLRDKVPILQGALALVGSTWIATETLRASGRTLPEYVAAVSPYAVALSAAIGIGGVVLARYTLWPVLGVWFRLSTVALILASGLAVLCVVPVTIETWWVAMVPVKDIGTPALACGLGVVTAYLLNRIVTPFAAAGFQHTTSRTNLLQRLVFKSLVSKSLVAVTLEDSKVYVGWVESAPAQTEAADGFIVLLPLLSGYRDKDSREVTFTTKYNDVVQDRTRQAANERQLENLLQPFHKVIPIAGIVYAGEFDEEHYAEFASQQSPADAEGTQESLNAKNDESRDSSTKAQGSAS